MLQLPAFVVVLALVQADDFEMPGQALPKIHQSILQRRYQRVGVIPRFLVREGTRESAGGSIGPEADLMAEHFEAGLVDASGGKYRVVDGRRMRQAFASLKIDDLTNPESLKRLAREVGGLDALVVCVVTDLRARGAGANGPPLRVQARLIEVADSSLAGAATESVEVSLSDAAYMGESWELRRWSGNRLAIVGLRPPADGPAARMPNALYGDSPLWENILYELIRRDRPHPLLDPACAFRMVVVVDGQERPLERVGNKVYSALDPGENYVIRVQNRIARPVYMSVFVDGINILGKRREHPSRAAYWYLKPSYTSNLKGWYTGGASGNYSVEEFVIAPADSAVAAGQGFGQQLGMITAVFWTAGMEGVPKPKDLFAHAMPGSFGTGAGRMSRTELGQVHGPPRGLILAAMTLHYVISPRLEELRRQAAQ